MNGSELTKEYFLDRYAKYNIKLTDGSDFEGMVKDLDFTPSGSIESLKVITAYNEDLIIAPRLILDIKPVVDEDPSSYVNFLEHFDDKTRLWEFELIRGSSVTAQVMNYKRGVHGDFLTLQLRTVEGEQFEIPWTSIVKIRYR